MPEGRPSRGEGGDGCRSGVFQSGSGDVERGAGCGDVVHEEQGEAADAAGAGDTEGAAEVPEPLLPAEAALGRRGAAAGEGGEKGEPQEARQGAADPLGLVVPPGEPAAPVEGHGDNGVEARELIPQNLRDRLRQMAPEIVQAPELQSLDDLVEGRLVAPQREQPVEAGRMLPAGRAPEA